MTRVLYVIATLDAAGAESQMTQLCLRLDRREFDPAVCCLTRGGPLGKDLREAGIPVRVLHKRGRWDLKALGRLAGAIREFDPRILHTWLPTANTLGRLAGIRARVPVTIASERAADAWKGRLRRWADRRLARRTDRIIANAEAVKRFLVNRIGVPVEKIHVVRNGLDLAKFDASAGAPPAPPLPESGGVPIIGTVGRLEPQKGMRHLVDAFSRLPSDPAGAELWIVGAGPDEGPLRERAEAAGVAEKVRFLGYRADVPALMNRFDLFVLPSLWEGLPNVVLEAMAARRAVVATAVDGTPEAAVAGETALLAPPGDPSALAEAISTLLRDPERRRAFGEAGRRRVAERFGMERMVRETEDVYRSALEGARHRG